MNIRLEKRHKYFAFSFIMMGLLYFYSGSTANFNPLYVSILTIVVLAGSYIVHIPNSKILNILESSILPLFLTLGFVLSYIYFPNLSRIFKLLSLLVYGFIFYMILLVNNVFLVVETRKETIPLYRVALTWSKILVVIVAIPLLAGVYKINLNSLFETGVTCLIALISYGYLLWSLKFNHEVKKYKAGELFSIFALSTFFVMSSNLAVSFVPSETFLRALFVSSVLIFGVSFIEAHLKNTINKKLIRDHMLISLIFLILIFIFNQ